MTNLAIPDADNIKNNDETFRAELLEVPQWWENNIYFRQKLAPFDDEHVRRAFMMAIDKDAIIAGVLKNLNPRIDGIFYPGMEVFNPDVKIIPYDAEGAVAELAASTYGSADALPAISFYTSPEADNTLSRILAVLQEMWNQTLGVQVEIRTIPTYAEMLASDVQIVLAGEAVHYPNANNCVGYLRGGSGSNISQFEDPAWDEKINIAESTLDPEESIRLYREAEQEVLDKAAIYPFYQVVAYFLVKPNVQGITPTAMYTFPNLDKVTIGG
jgi:oligopeptide transport system substrate-binding protein